MNDINWRSLEAAAHKTISELVKQQSLGDDKRLLNRLRDHPEMRTDVWRKLPAIAQPDIADRIIRWAFYGYKVAHAYARPPFPKDKKKIADYLAKYPSIPTSESAFIRAEGFCEAMDATRGDAEDRWDSLSPEVTFQRIYRLVQRIAAFYRALDQETKVLIAAINLPKIRKRNSPKAPEWVFSQLMSDRFQNEFGRPLDPVVSALTAVVFQRKNGVGNDTVRGRRRRIGPTVHSRKKPR
jgi:hypothetical protein